MQLDESLALPDTEHVGSGAGRMLEALYVKLNRRRYVAPDPLQTLYAYHSLPDREIAALVASSLAFGEVRQIVRSVESVLDTMGRPYRFLEENTETAIHTLFKGFRRRYASGQDLALLLCGAKRVLKGFGSLQACFQAHQPREADTVLPGLNGLVQALSEPGEGRRNFLLPSPSAGSACKRWHLFLRWMVRRDAVDPGGWEGVSPAQLVAPLDIHMHRLARRMGLTQRRQADARTALEVTAAFRRWSPADPVKYDFALTRLGIRSDMDPEWFCSAWNAH